MARPMASRRARLRRRRRRRRRRFQSPRCPPARSCRWGMGLGCGVGWGGVGKWTLHGLWMLVLLQGHNLPVPRHRHAPPTLHGTSPSMPQLVGLHTDRLKLKTAAISLDGLLDYNTSDKCAGSAAGASWPVCRMPACCCSCCSWGFGLSEPAAAWTDPTPPCCPPYSAPVRRDEGTFELSLFAEALHDALMRDAGATVLAELYKQR